MSLHPSVRRLVDAATAEEGFSGRVLLTTIFGDALLPRRQPIAVVQLAELVEPFNISDRLVRTTLLRLTRDELVTSERRGRFSFYTVHPDSEAVFRNANERIYADAGLDQPWDGHWTVAVIDPDGSSPTDRQRCATEFGWLGTTEIASGVHAAPTVSPTVLEAVAERIGVRLAITMRGPLSSGTVDEETQRTRQVDPQGRLRALHETHADRFAAFEATAADLGPLDAFIVRTLLINGWRRIALRSPQLPAKLLPSDWPAADNLARTRRLHDALWPASEGHLDAALGAAPASRSLFGSVRSAG